MKPSAGQVAWGVLRVLYGLFFITMGAWVFASVAGTVPAPVQPTAKATA